VTLSASMEETGVLVNLALLDLVLPDFEPGPKKGMVQKWPFSRNTRFVSTAPDRCRVVAGLCEAGRGRRLRLPIVTVAMSDGMIRHR